MIHQQRALVTGASEGIGRVFAQRLATAGYRVTAVARTESKLKALVQELGGDAHSYHVADLSTPAGIEQIAAELRENHYTLLVNNAGMGSYGAMANTPLVHLQQMMRINCDAVVALSHAFVDKAERGDALINVSSSLCFMPAPYDGVYAATKAFVTAFTETLWFEQQSRGVYAMALCPGPVRTTFDKDSGRHVPAMVSQPPEAVVQIALTALQRRAKPIVLSQRFGLNLFTLVATRLLSRKAMISVIGRSGGPPATAKQSTSA